MRGTFFILFTFYTFGCTHEHVYLPVHVGLVTVRCCLQTSVVVVVSYVKTEGVSCLSQVLFPLFGQLDFVQEGGSKSSEVIDYTIW